MLEKKDNKYIFTVRQKEYEVFFAEDGQTEVYETKNPAETGFIFNDRKRFIIFVNMLTDIAEKELNYEEKNGCEDSD